MELFAFNNNSYTCNGDQKIISTNVILIVLFIYFFLIKKAQTAVNEKLYSY